MTIEKRTASRLAAPSAKRLRVDAARNCTCGNTRAPGQSASCTKSARVWMSVIVHGKATVPKKFTEVRSPTFVTSANARNVPVGTARPPRVSPVPRSAPEGTVYRDQSGDAGRSKEKLKSREQRISRGLCRMRQALSSEEGMSTAEYAVGTIAAVAFAGVLLKVLTSDTVSQAVSDIITRALS